MSELGNNARLQAALACDDRGWKVIPIPPGRKAPARGGWQNVRLTREELYRHFASGNNIGVLTGEPSGHLIDTDLDWDSATRLASEFLPPTDLISGRTKRPESHRWYTSEVKTQKFIDPTAPDKKKAMIVEIRSSGCQTVIAPSTHPDGDTYRWDQEGEAAPVAGPDLIRAVGKLAACCLISRYWTEGSRHALTLPLAGMLCRAGWSELDAEHFVRCASWAAGDPELRDRLTDVRTTYEAARAGRPTTGIPTLKKLLPPALVDSITMWLALPAHEADTEPAVGADSEPFDDIYPSDLRTERANAKRLAAAHGSTFRWVYTWNKFLLWEGRRWALNQTIIEGWAKDIANNLWYLAPAGLRRAVDDKPMIRAIISFIKASNSANGVQNMLYLARSEVGIPIHHELLNARPLLFNCLNGTLDLENGKLRPHQPEDYLTTISNVVFDPRATCPTFEKFIKEIFESDESIPPFIQRAGGYSLTGSVIERVMLFLSGAGANGKTTLIEILADTMGDYASPIASEMLMVSKYDRHPTEKSDLYGRRFVFTSETEQGRRLAESAVKHLTGNDRIVCRRMREDSWKFSPTHKLWMAGNYRPRIVGTDDGIWDRIALVEFKERFPDDDPRCDPNLREKLRAELSGILNWLLRGCLDWQRNGLQKPNSVTAATETYRTEMDFVGQFIDEQCVLGKDKSAPTPDLYEVAKKYSPEMTLTAFAFELDRRGFPAHKATAGRYKDRKVRQGIALAETTCAQEKMEWR